MTRILGIIAVSAFLLCAVLVGLSAWFAGGNWVFPSGFVGVLPQAQSAGTKEWNWSGGDRIELDVPAVVHYQSGGDARVIVHGPQAMIDRVQFADGKLAFDRSWMRHEDRLDVTLRGMTIRTFSIHGSARLKLGHIDQDALHIDISGSGSAQAEGRADDVDLDVSGAGTAHFGQLAAKAVRIEISGAGDAEIAPSDSATVSISGAGKVKLFTRPKSLSTHISGAGRVIQAGP